MNSSKMSCRLATWVSIIVFGALFFGVGVPMVNKALVAEKATKGTEVVSTNNFFGKMEAELETTKNGDILETRQIEEWAGSRHTLLVVTQDSRDGRVFYQVKGGEIFLQSSSELAQRIVKVYRVGTPEWREKAEEFVKQ